MYCANKLEARLRVSSCHQDPILRAGVSTMLMRSGADMVPDGPSAQLVITGYADGLARARTIGARSPQQKILIVTQLDREWDVLRALAAGVHGYLLQSCSAEQLHTAVQALARGQHYLSPELCHYTAGNDTRDHLTEREAEVLQLLAEGCCNKTIARELGIGIGTVKTHVRGVFDKLGASARTEAVVLASRRGLLTNHRQAH